MDEKDPIELTEAEILRKVLQNLADNKEMLEHLNTRSERAEVLLDLHSRTLSEILENQKYWKDIASNTNRIASAIDTYGEQNMKLIDVVIGKKQVPLSVFLAVLVIIGISAMIQLSSILGIEVVVDPSHIEIKKPVVEGPVIPEVEK